MLAHNRQSLITFIASLALGALAAITAGASMANKPVEKFDLTGDVEGMEPPHRAHITATAKGKARRSVTMSPGGAFLFRSLTPGRYTIRPSHARYTFSPSYRNITVRGHDVQNVHFRAHPSSKRR